MDKIVDFNVGLSEKIPVLNAFTYKTTFASAIFLYL